MIRRQLPAWSPLTSSAVLSAGWTLLAGGRRHVERVERLVRDEYDASAVALTDSGTSALALAMKLAATEWVGSGGTPLVALPAYCCFDVATAADMADVEVVLYDLDPTTLGPDPASLAAALAFRPSSVVVAHLYGVPVDMDCVSEVAQRAGAVVIEDAAQGVGARLRGRRLGTLAPLSVLSFGRGKGRTGGRGGALLAHGGRFADLVGQVQLDGGRGALGDFAQLKAQWLVGRPSIYGILASIPALGLGETVYRGPHPVRGIPASAAAALCATWAWEPVETRTRVRQAGQLMEALRDHPRYACVTPPAGAEPGWLRLPVVTAEDLEPGFTAREAARLGVMPGYPEALCDLVGFMGRVRNISAAFPGARLLARSLGTLPTHSQLDTRDLARLGDWLRPVLRGGPRPGG